ncbi:MAG: ABC transporter permease [Nesterenkonia sp.]
MIRAQEETDSGIIPRLEVGSWLESGFNWLNDNFGAFFDFVEAMLLTLTDDWLGVFLNWPDALLMAVIFALIGWLVRDWKLGVLSLALMTFIITVDMWGFAMDTLAMVLVAAFFALVIAIPVGILAAKSQRASQVVRPIMDLMQTMPAFVWLPLVLTLFGLNVTAGVVATFIFCLPPGARFTELGIRQVDSEVVEAGYAFGSTPRQILFRIQLPLAARTIMAGVGQVIMLALSMAVIAGFVGAGGLGGEVTRAITTVDIALGFESGLSVVMLAVFLDRVTAAISGGEGLLPKVLRRRRRSAPTEEQTESNEATPAKTAG